MAWSDDALPVLRTYINDPDRQMYSDSRLTTVLISAAYTNVFEFGFTDYTISVTSETITPDPSSNTDFMMLLVMKAALLVYSGELKDAANNSFSMKDLTSSIDATTRTKDAKTAYEEMLLQFNEAKRRYQFNGSLGAFVVSPYTSSYVSKGSNL